MLDKWALDRDWGLGLAFEAPESSQCGDNYAVAPQVVSIGDLFHPQGWEPGLLQGVHQHVAWHGPP